MCNQTRELVYLDLAINGDGDLGVEIRRRAEKDVVLIPVVYPGVA